MAVHARKIRLRDAIAGGAPRSSHATAFNPLHHHFKFDPVARPHDTPAPNIAEQRGKMIKLLEDALMLADDLEDGNTGYLIERAFDEARSRQFTPKR